MGVVIAIVVVAVLAVALAWWWVGRARAVEHNARSAAQRAEVDARIQQQYRASRGNPPAKPGV
jgi:type II secretory pathway pseudopilin PulG